MLRAGVSKVEITPPVGMPMAGFARVLPSLGVHDPLWARAVVLDDGVRRAGIVVADVVGVSAELTEEVRQRAGVPCGLDPDGLLVAGTHTHSGPGRGEDPATQQYWQALPGQLAEAVRGATEALVPARLGSAVGWSAMGVNRREHVPEGGVQLGRDAFGRFDTDVGVLRLDRADGGPLACVITYACHAVCLLASNYLISGDYPAFAVNLFELAMGRGVTALFLNGACGNVNPREAGQWFGAVSDGGFHIAERAGQNLAREALRTWHTITLQEETALACARRQIELPVDPARALRVAEARVRSAEAQAAAPPPDVRPYTVRYVPPDPEAARRRLEDLRARPPSPVSCEIQALRFGRTALLGWPGEVFCELGVATKQRSPLAPTCIVGYANGSIGYVPTPEAFAQGGYEVDSAAHLADRAGTVLVDESAALLESLTCE